MHLNGDLKTATIHQAGRDSGPGVPQGRLAARSGRLRNRSAASSLPATAGSRKSAPAVFVLMHFRFTTWIRTWPGWRTTPLFRQEKVNDFFGKKCCSCTIILFKKSYCTCPVINSILKSLFTDNTIRTIDMVYSINFLMQIFNFCEYTQIFRITVTNSGDSYQHTELLIRK